MVKVSTILEKSDYFVISLVCAAAGTIIYSVLTYLFVAPQITIPISIIISILIFGLTKYYTASNIVTCTKDQNLATCDCLDDRFKSANQEKNGLNISTSLFVVAFATMILVCILTPKQDSLVFADWSETGITDIVQLSSAIMLCFFVPGYAVVRLIIRKFKMNRMVVVLLAYLLSMVITGLPAYIAAILFDSAISESKNLFISIYLCILFSFVIFTSAHKIRDLRSFQINIPLPFPNYLHSIVRTGLGKYLKLSSSELLVFGSLLVLLVISTYYLYGGITIGDQWVHQGRALLFMSGSFREAALSNAEYSYPPLQSALLAALATLSGLPLVNAYASIAFLNIIPVFAFYYFFSAWVPRSMKKGALFASTLFTLSAGFGWIYLFAVSVPNQPIDSEELSLQTLGNLRHLDIIRTSNFVIPTSPDFSTGLIYIVLPLGFLLLGLITTCKNSIINSSLIIAISVLGIMTNDEFYIFIIIASLLPIIFRINARTYLYFSFLIALCIVFAIDLISPGKFFTLIKIMGVPLLLLNVIFVTITWALYSVRKHLQKVSKQILSFIDLRKISYFQDDRIKVLNQTLLMFAVAYSCVLCFIVLSQLPLDSITVQNFDRKLPWYLYPMRIGVVGLLGLAFVVSYVFKKFEKQIFVFGILILVSLLAGPYYDEHRFSKYIMVGTIGFASLLLYKILSLRFTSNPAYSAVIISTVIITSSLSILIFIGFNSLILQTQDFSNTLPRRDFPSMSQIHLFEALNDKVDPELKRYNVVSFPVEYNYWQSGLISKIQGFAGLPKDKIYQSPLTLNASTLDALFRNLGQTNAQYIILPKDTIPGASEPTRFAFDNFKRVYETSNYTVLDIPPLSPPVSTSKTEISLLYDPRDLPYAKVSGLRLLPYDNDTFDFNERSDTTGPHQDNQNETLIRLASINEDGDTLWSRSIVPATNMNYVEVPFRIAAHNEKKSHSINLKWLEEDKEYSTVLTGNHLELHQKSLDNKDKKLLVRNDVVEKNDLIWYNIKVVSLDNSISIYVNNELKIQTSRLQAENNTGGISRVGLESNFNDVEFGPIKIGSISVSAQKIYQEARYYDYYYPLSLVALSESKYAIFDVNDLSSFSNDVILASDNLNFDNDTMNKYLEYVRAGGKLIAINSNNNFSNPFSELFSIKSIDSNEHEFAKIALNKGDHNVLVNVPGKVKTIDIKSDPNVNVIASYRDSNNQTIAPFIIEKLFSNRGKIVLINANGYFKTISESPQRYFLSLSNVSKLLDFNSSKINPVDNTSKPVEAFIGTMTVSGKVSIKSSSLSISDDASNTHDVHASQIAIFNNTNHLHKIFNDVIIKDLKLIGDYGTSIAFRGSLDLPNMRSNQDYFDIKIPSDFNMTVNIAPSNHSYTQIVIQNDTGSYILLVNYDSKIEFHNVRSESPSKFMYVLMKSPEVEVSGNASIKNVIFRGFIANRGNLESGSQLDLQGKLKVKLDFIDQYNQDYRSGTRISHLTYLKSIKMDGHIDQHNELLKLPGDISAEAKLEGTGIPLERVLTSSTNIFSILLLSIVTIFGRLLLRKRWRY